MKNRPNPRFTQKVEYEFDGAKYTGTFHVEDGWVYLSCAYGLKKAAVRNDDPEALAKLLFNGILEHVKHKGLISKPAT
jgi:hypothetical protein